LGPNVEKSGSRASTWSAEKQRAGGGSRGEEKKAEETNYLFPVKAGRGRRQGGLDVPGREMGSRKGERSARGFGINGTVRPRPLAASMLNREEGEDSAVDKKRAETMVTV